MNSQSTTADQFTILPEKGEGKPKLRTLEVLGASLQLLLRAVDNTKVAWRIILGLLVIHIGLLMYSAYVHSPTLNEPGHLVAGLSHWKFGRFELYRVNPPLVRMVAALPVMAVGYEEDWTKLRDVPGARPVFDLGHNFIAANGVRSLFLFTSARWACIPFSLLGLIICFLWGRDLFGRPAGILASMLWCFSPNILAHASLITADTGGTALGVAACYTFWRWLKKPTWTQAALTGCVLGLAELAKTTLILFYPLWPLLWIAYRWRDRHKFALRDWGKEATMLALRMVIGIYVLNLGYGFEGSFKPLAEFHFSSNLFTGNDETSIANDSNNRFTASWLGNLPVPFPKNYLLGIDIQQRDFEHYGRHSYLRSQWQDHGWWYYYLYAAAIKVPLATWLLGLLAMTEWLRCRQRALRSARVHDLLILLTPALVVFCVVSSKTGFNEHFRYVLPVFPFMFIWISSSLAKRLPLVRKSFLDMDQSTVVHKSPQQKYSRRLLASFAIPVLILWSTASALWIYPHSLSYFNESIGGPRNGPMHLLSSNIDWGQDLRYLAWSLERQSCNAPLRLAYFGGYDPIDIGIKCIGLPPEITELSVVNSRDATKCYAVSVNFAYGYPRHAICAGFIETFGQDDLLGYGRILHFDYAAYSIRYYRNLSSMPYNPE